MPKKRLSKSWWLSATACLVLLVVGVVSLRFAFGYFGVRRSIVFGEGAAYITVRPPVGNPGNGWYFSRIPFGFVKWFDHRVGFMGLQQYWIPLWMPLMFPLFVCVVIWWRNRRYPSDHCLKCGYNLTGNQSGICPECGTNAGIPLGASRL